MTAPEMQPKSAAAIRREISELVQQYANIAYAPSVFCLEPVLFHLQANLWVPKNLSTWLRQALMVG